VIALQRVDASKRSGNLLLPSVAMPDDQNIVRWLDTFTDTEIEHSLNWTRKKFQFLPSQAPVVIYKYVTGVLVNQRETASAARLNGGQQ
jgi:hypothetical protein